jgi:hypothetical protein
MKRITISFEDDNYRGIQLLISEMLRKEKLDTIPTLTWVVNTLIREQLNSMKKKNHSE